jgi:hypothetical protein
MSYFTQNNCNSGKMVVDTELQILILFIYLMWSVLIILQVIIQWKLLDLMVKLGQAMNQIQDRLDCRFPPEVVEEDNGQGETQELIRQRRK